MDKRGDRSLTLHHTRFDRKPMDEDNSREVLKHIHRLWGFDVHLHSLEESDIKQSFTCPQQKDIPPSPS